MDEKEEKGFVVKDRRKVSLDDAGQGPDGEPIREQAKAETDKQSERDFAEASQESHDKDSVPLPEVSMATFIFSLSSSALLHLGEIPDPETKNVRVDLPLAKQIIDTLGMLEEKTKGNLDPDEDNLLKTVLYDLRLRYVQKSK
ncbi:MAG TPA: DUF1844 domain-containing protein [Syntrophobacteraceae bacterium]|nr:DUF1844 domain-containing protein [Syntrophobacteraceae bacterium]